MIRPAPDLSGHGRRVAIVVSRFNESITERLLEGCVTTLRGHGVAESDVGVFPVPGAFEIPLVTRRLAQQGRWHAIIALGCVIRGETPHFEYVAGAASRGVAEVALQAGVPVIFGVVTAETSEQAIDRSGGKLGNRGADAARAALEMANLLAQFP